MKHCARCKVYKSFLEFHKSKKYKDWLRCSCKECYKKERIKNADKIAEQKRWYYLRNKERLLKRDSEYRAKNKNKKSLYHQNWYEQNKERVLILQKEYYKKEDAKMLAQSRRNKRRALLSNVRIEKISKEFLKTLFESQDKKCNICSTYLNFDIKYSVHLDHIIPISKWWKHIKTNLQYLCSTCNLKKWSKICI